MDTINKKMTLLLRYTCAINFIILPGMEYGFREKKFYSVIYHMIFEPSTFFRNSNDWKTLKTSIYGNKK